MKTAYKNKKKIKTKKIHSYETPIWILFLFCILIFYPPFFRGLFFQKELLVTHIFTFFILTVWLYIKIKSDNPVFQSVPDLLALGIVFLYFISIFYSVNTRLAIVEFMKYANYFAIYLLARDLSRGNEKNRNIISNVFLFSGAIVAIIGIGSAIGTFNYKGAFVGNRINSTLQYPNALAAYLCALLILSLGYLENSTSIKGKYVYGALANLILFTFIPTFSRGMWLMAPIILIIYFILIPNSKKLESLVYGFAVIVPAAVCSFAFIKSLEGGNAFLQWGLLLISILITVGLIYLRQRFFDFTANLNYKRVLIAGGACIVIIAIITTIAFNVVAPLTLSNMDVEEDTSKCIVRDISDVEENKTYTIKADVKTENPNKKDYAGKIDIYSIDKKGKSENLVVQTIQESGQLTVDFTVPQNAETTQVRFLNYYKETEITFNKAVLYDKHTGKKIKDIKLKYKYLPEQLVSRLHSISLKERSAQSRTTFYKDAFKIIKDYPVLGAGGGGWEALYFMYQSYMYWSTQAHNYFMQLWIEIGTVGFLLFIAFALTMLWNSLKTAKRIENDDTKLIHITICMAWLTLLAHSTMDFDLSLGALSIVLWTLMGITVQEDVVFNKLQIKNKKARYAFLLIPLVLFISVGSFHLAKQQARKSVIEAQNGSITNAIEHMKDAVKLSPFNESYRIDLATMYAAVASQDVSYLEKSFSEVEKTVKREPYNAKLLKKAGQIYIQTGQFEKGLEYMDKAVKVQPMNTNNYLEQANAYLLISKYWIDKNQVHNLLKNIDKIANIKNSIIKMSERSLKPVEYNKELNLAIQKLDYILDYKDNTEKLKLLDKVVLYNKFDLDLDKDGIPDGTWTSDSEGGKIKANIDKQGVMLKNTGQDYGVFWIQDFHLNPNKDYTVALEYKNTMQTQNANMYLYDYTKKETRTSTIFENINISPEFTKAETSINIPSDIADEKQRIGIIHRGKDTGAIYIKKIAIFEN